MCTSLQGLAFQFCEREEVGNHPQEDLAKFGYRSEGILENSYCVLATRCNLILSKYGDFIFLFLENYGEKKILCRICTLPFFLVAKSKNLPQNKMLLLLFQVHQVSYFFLCAQTLREWAHLEQFKTQFSPELISHLEAPIIPRFNTPLPSAVIFLQLCDIKNWQFFSKPRNFS